MSYVYVVVVDDCESLYFIVEGLYGSLTQAKLHKEQVLADFTGEDKQYMSELYKIKKIKLGEKLNDHLLIELARVKSEIGRLNKLKKRD